MRFLIPPQMPWKAPFKARAIFPKGGLKTEEIQVDTWNPLKARRLMKEWHQYGAIGSYFYTRLHPYMGEYMLECYDKDRKSSFYTLRIFWKMIWDIRWHLNIKRNRPRDL